MKGDTVPQPASTLPLTVTVRAQRLRLTVGVARVSMGRTMELECQLRTHRLVLGKVRGTTCTYGCDTGVSVSIFAPLLCKFSTVQAGREHRCGWGTRIEMAGVVFLSSPIAHEPQETKEGKGAVWGQGLRVFQSSHMEEDHGFWNGG